jgi:hypothetical protein
MGMSKRQIPRGAKAWNFARIMANMGSIEFKVELLFLQIISPPRQSTKKTENLI